MTSKPKKADDWWTNIPPGSILLFQSNLDDTNWNPQKEMVMVLDLIRKDGKVRHTNEQACIYSVISLTGESKTWSITEYNAKLITVVGKQSDKR